MPRIAVPVLIGCLLLVLSGCASSGGSGSTAVQSGPVPTAAIPAVTAILPASIVAGSPGQTITVTGSGFGSGSAVQIDGTALPTTFVSATSLTATLPDTVLANGRVASVTVANGTAVGTSSAFSWTVTSPTPTVSGLTPSSVPQGVAVPVTVNGSGFEANSSVLWNCLARPTTFVSATALQVQLTASDVQTYGTGQVTVSNPGPGGSATAPSTLSVVATYTVSAVAPSAVTVGSAAQTLTITGSGFATGAVVALDTLNLQTTTVNATTLQAVVPASALLAERTAKVTVSVPGATQAASTPLSLVVNSSLPVLNAVTPANLVQGKAASVTLTGTGFQADSTVPFNGTARPGTVTSSTSLQVALTAADLQTLGATKFAVSNPAPGGGMSATLSVNVVPAVTIASVIPASLTVTSVAQSLTITGSGFAAGATASLDGTALVTTFSSATTLYATVPASLLTLPRTASLVVANSSNGTTSNTFSLPVNGAQPNLYYASPSSIAQGQTATVSLTGFNFQQNSVVQLNGVAKTTTYVNSSQLQFTLTTTDTQTGGTLSITVSSPGQSGGVSNPISFTVVAPPAITAVAPASIVATSGPQTVTVTGTGFSYGSTITLDGVSLQTNYSSPTQLTAVIPAASLLNGRTAVMQASAGYSGTGTSATFNYPITSPVPALASLLPSAVPVGQAAIVTVNGSGFEGNSSVQWNGVARPTTFRTTSTLLVALSAADLPSTGTGAITVNNPGPGTSTSGPLTLNIANIPVILSLAPSTLTVVPASNSPASVALTVANLATGATVQAGGASLPIMAQTASQITVSIPASYLASPGSLLLTVTNPPQGSMQLISTPAYLSITEAGTGFTVSPNSAAVGSADLTVTVSGTGLYPDSVVFFNGVQLATTYVSAGKITAVIPAATLGKLGAATLLVQTPETPARRQRCRSPSLNRCPPTT